MATFGLLWCSSSIPTTSLRSGSTFKTVNTEILEAKLWAKFTKYDSHLASGHTRAVHPRPAGRKLSGIVDSSRVAEQQGDLRF